MARTHQNYTSFTAEAKRKKESSGGRRYKTDRIKDDISRLDISRQRKYQLRKKRQGLCTICGKKAFEGLVLCFEHMQKRGVHNPGKNKRLSREIHLLAEHSANVHWDIYQDKEKRWRWAKQIDGNVVAMSDTAFFSRQACTRNASRRGFVGK